LTYFVKVNNMKYFTNYLIAFFFLILCTVLQSQDAHFSQFYNVAHQINPALIGVYNGSFRASVTYRDQWATVLGGSPFRTASTSFDIRKPILKGDYIGFGATVLRDEVHSSNFRQDRAHLGFSYMKKLRAGKRRAGGQYLIAGGQIGAGQNGFQQSELWFSEQYDGRTERVDRLLPSGEKFSDFQNPTFLDANAGLLWYNVFDENQSLYFGGAIHHLTAPNVSLQGDGTVPLERKFVAQIGGEFPIFGNNGATLLPSVIAQQQGASTNVLFGSNFRYTQREWREVALRIGGWAHVTNKLESGFLMNAFVLATTLEMDKLNISLSYDLNTSSLSLATNARGAFELSILYTQPFKGRKWRVDCPKF